MVMPLYGNSDGIPYGGEPYDSRSGAGRFAGIAGELPAAYRFEGCFGEWAWRKGGGEPSLLQWAHFSGE